MDKKQIQNFWDAKILGWDNDKYSTGKVIDVNSSIKFRLQTAENVIRKHGKDKVILELGCGSARLIDAAEACGAKKYIGIDISKSAIDAVKKRESELKRKIQVELLHGDVCDFDLGEVDICISLGVLDWLSLDEIKAFHKKINSKFFLHSYSERRASITQALHSLYVFLMYGHKTKQYIPRYYSESQMREIFTNTKSHTPIGIFRHTKLTFGTLAYNLPGNNQEPLI